MSSRRLLLALAALLVLALPSAGQARATKHRAARAHAAVICASSSATPVERSLAGIRQTTLCLLNAERARYGLRPLKPSTKLRHASERHSSAMVADHFFAHGDFFGRIRGSGYLNGVHAYTVGENIAWGGGPVASPARIVRMWMNSPPHRANILNRTYVHIGIGVVRGTPVGIAGGTYTTDFGYRR
jgi:uncharacterized protein YkwD